MLPFYERKLEWVEGKDIRVPIWFRRERLPHLLHRWVQFMIEDERDFVSQLELRRSYLILALIINSFLNHCFGMVWFWDIFHQLQPISLVFDDDETIGTLPVIVANPWLTIAHSHSHDLCVSSQMWDKGGGTERLWLYWYPRHLFHCHSISNLQCGARGGEMERVTG